MKLREDCLSVILSGVEESREITRSSAAGSLDFAWDDNRVCCKKAPARFSRALGVSTWKTALSLRPSRSRGSRFLVLNHRCSLGCQYNFAYDNAIAHCRVVNGDRHVRANRRQTDNTACRIHHGRILRVVIPYGRRSRRCSEHEVIRVWCVGDDTTRCAGSRLLRCGRPRYGVCSRCGC